MTPPPDDVPPPRRCLSGMPRLVLALVAWGALLLVVVATVKVPSAVPVIVAGAPLLLLLDAIRCVVQGLAVKSATRADVVVTAEGVVSFRSKGAPRSIALRDISRATLTVDESWAESLSFEDALTITCSARPARLKVPSSTVGFDELLEALTRHGVDVGRVSVSAPW